MQDLCIAKRDLQYYLLGRDRSQSIVDDKILSEDPDIMRILRNYLIAPMLRGAVRVVSDSTDGGR